MASQFVQDIVIRLRADSREAQNALADVEAGYGKLASGAALGAAAVAAVSAGVAALVATINRGQGVSELTTAFQHLGGELPRLREATQGLVSDMDLMRASNQAMLAGLSPEQFEQVAQAADALGDAVGVGTKEAMDGLTLSIASGNERMLKQFGILVDNKKAEEDFAASIGLTASQLNEAGKREAFRIAALEQMKQKTQELGEAQATAGDGLQRLQNATSNLFDGFARGINENEQLAEAIQHLSDAVSAIDPQPLIWLTNALIDFVSVPINYISERVEKMHALYIIGKELLMSEEERSAANAQMASDKLEADAKLALSELDAQLRLRKSKQLYEDHAASVKAASEAQKKATEAWDKGAEALDKLTIYGAKYTDWLVSVNESAIGPWVIDEAEADESRERQKNALQDAYQESTDFWEQILYGVIDGDLEDVLVGMLKRSAVQFGAELLAQATSSFAGFDIGSLMQGGGLMSGELAGASGLGIGAAAIGTAYSGFRFGNDILDGKKASWLDSAVLAPVTGGFSLLGPFAGGFGGGKGEDQQRRDAGRSSLFDRGIIDSNHEFSLFGGGRGSLSPGGEFGGFNQGADKFGGFGSVLSMASGGDNSLKELYANALSEADSFNSAAQTTIGLLSDMGVSAEESQQMLIDAYNEGAISLGEFNEGMDAAAILARDDLGSVEEGFQLLAETIDGPPKDSLKALQLTFAEIKQSGVQDTEGLLAVIEQKMGPEAREVFKRLADAGITQFTDFNTLSAGQIQLLFNEMTNLKQPFDDVGSAGESAGRRGADGLGKIESKLGDIKRKAKEAKDALEDVGNAV